MHIIDRGPNVSLQDLEEFEKKHHITLPESYRAFLLEFNGGSPNPSSYRSDSGVDVTVARLFSLRASTFAGDLETNCQGDVPGGLLEEGTIAVGYDFAAQPILLRVDGRSTGVLYLLIDGVKYLIAQSFSEFIANLENRVGMKRSAYDDLMSAVFMAEKNERNSGSP